MDSSLRKTQSMQHSPLKALYGKTYYKRTVVMVGLDVKGAFDAAWWPCILSNLRGLRCPKKSVQPDSQLPQRQGSFSSSKHAYSKEECDERLFSMFMLWARVAAAHLLRSWFRIPSGGMDICLL